MNYKLILFLSIEIFSLRCQEKHIIGATVYGFFSNFFGVINNLDWCDKNNITPVVYWNTTSAYHEHKLYRNTWNAWEYYFYQVSDKNYTEGDKIYGGCNAPDGSLLVDHFSRNIMEIRERAHDLIIKYIKILPYVQQIIDNFYDSKMKAKITIGIHLRGTDKGSEVKQASVKKIIETANSFAKKTYPAGSYQFLVASDEQKLLDYAKNNLCGPVIYYDAVRSKNNKPLHVNNSQPARIGLDILVETLLLSLTDTFIHTNSNIACGVLVFNTKLPNIPLYEEITWKNDPDQANAMY